MFSRYRIFHLEDFTCVPSASIDSGKTHQKLPAHFLVFHRFFAKCVWQIFQTGFTFTSPHPHPLHYTNMFCRFMLFRPVSQTQNGVRGGIEYDVPHLSKIHENYIKKILRIVIDYRCILPVLRKNPLKISFNRRKCRYLKHIDSYHSYPPPVSFSSTFKFETLKSTQMYTARKGFYFQYFTVHNLINFRRYSDYDEG